MSKLNVIGSPPRVAARCSSEMTQLKCPTLAHAQRGMQPMPSNPPRTFRLEYMVASSQHNPGYFLQASPEVPGAAGGGDPTGIGVADGGSAAGAPASMRQPSALSRARIREMNERSAEVTGTESWLL